MFSPNSPTRDDEMKFRLFIQTTIAKINSDWTSGKIVTNKTIQQDWIKFTYSIEENHNQSGNRKLTLDFIGSIKHMWVFITQILLSIIYSLDSLMLDFNNKYQIT